MDLKKRIIEESTTRFLEKEFEKEFKKELNIFYENFTGNDTVNDNECPNCKNKFKNGLGCHIKKKKIGKKKRKFKELD